MRGLFVVLEGGDGCGKSTQRQALEQKLFDAGYPAVCTREPGGTPESEEIRRWIMDVEDLSPVAELFLFEAARATLVERIIRPALERGEIVVSERYTYSSVAYQGYGRGLSVEAVDCVNDIATGGLVPDLVVWLDLPAEKVLERKAREALDRFEHEGLAFHQRVRDGYLDMSMQPGTPRWLKLDASLPKLWLTDAIMRTVDKMYAEKRAE